MKKRILLGVILVVMVMENAGPVLAAGGSVQEWASSDAVEAVINRRPVNEGEVCQRGAEYANAFLSGFAQASRVYEQAFRQGVSDGVNHRPTVVPVDHVARAGYQRGFEYGCRQQSPQPHDAQPPVTDQGPVVTEPDSEDYPAKVPSPDQVKFISRIAKSAQRVGMECDLYPSVIIAQAALESNWGASGLAQKPYHNLFGVKGTFNGHSVKQVTTEYTPEGKPVTIKDFFRWYDSDYQSLHDYAKTLADPLYEGVHRTSAHNYREATHALLGKYATDPHYDRKLNRLIDSYQLTKYDHRVTAKEKDAKPVTPPVADAGVHEAAATPPAKHHHVGWLSVAGGIGSAGALGLLRRFISIK